MLGWDSFSSRYRVAELTNDKSARIGWSPDQTSFLWSVKPECLPCSNATYIKQRFKKNLREIVFEILAFFISMMLLGTIVLLSVLSCFILEIKTTRTIVTGKCSRMIRISLNSFTSRISEGDIKGLSLWIKSYIVIIEMKARYSAVLSCGANYYAVQGGSNFWVCEWNPKVWPFKWKLLSSNFLWCCLLCCTRWF